MNILKAQPKFIVVPTYEVMKFTTEDIDDIISWGDGWIKKINAITLEVSECLGAGPPLKHMVNVGDYIMRIQEPPAFDQYYPINPKVFMARYKQVEP